MSYRVRTLSCDQVKPLDIRGEEGCRSRHPPARLAITTVHENDGLHRLRVSSDGTFLKHKSGGTAN